MITRIPAWLILKFVDAPDGLTIIHIVAAGFHGAGRMFDPFIRFYLNKDFERQLAAHAQEEFPKLGEMLKH